MKTIKIVVALLTLIPLYTHSLQRESLISCAKALPSQAKQLASMYPKTTGALLATFALGTTWYLANGYERHEDWNKNKLDLSKFSSEFKWGVATSDLQLCGIETDDENNNNVVKNNWTEWEKDLIAPKDNRPFWKYLLDEFTGDYRMLQQRIPRIPEERRMGTATDHWKKYPEDYALAKDFGLDSIRISLEWSKYQPNGPNSYNKKVIKHYIDQIIELKRLGMNIKLCFYHHALPSWFDQDGGFEKAENIQKFVDATTYILKKINKRIQLDENDYILTFNEPAGYALAAYIYGKYPPGKKFQFRQCGIVLKNMLDAHSAMYKAFKKINSKIQISIAHMMQPLQPYNPWNPLDVLPALLFGHLLNNVTLEYLSTGKFKWFGCFNETNPEVVGTLDFVGVNYYTHTLLYWFKAKVRPTEMTGDANEGEQGKAIYPEGLYDSIKKVNSYFPELPIYITELGLATSDKETFKTFFDQSLYQIQKCITEGINITGLDWWTLLTDYGWNGGVGNNYGLYHVDYNKDDKPRSLKPSSEHYKNCIAEHKRIHTHDVLSQKEIDRSIR